MSRKKFRGSMLGKGSTKMVFVSILVCFITLGFAAISTDLSISGTTKITKGTWNVHFANVRVFGGNNVTTAVPTITDDTSVEFNVTFDPLNDYYKFLVDVENTGLTDAMIGNISLPTIASNLEFSVTYKDGTTINKRDALKAGEKKTLLVVLKCKDSTLSGEIYSNINFAIDYVQTDEDVIVPNVEYTVDDFINITNGVTTDLYTDGVGAEMYAFEHPATEQLEASVDYHYIGRTPDNYIIFNNEVWRILGVFPTEDESGTIRNRLKIIKNSGVTNVNIMWDYKKKGVGSSTTDYGSNDWTDAQIMYFLNPDDISNNAGKKGYSFDGKFVRDTSGNIIYEKGKRPAEIAQSAAKYNGTVDVWTIEEDKKYIDKVKYYLGGIDSPEISVDNFYAVERGATVLSGKSKNWFGKVGLMYPSDYGYTLAKGLEDTCFKDIGICHHCQGRKPENSWMFIPGYDQWTITPQIYDTYHVFTLDLCGFINPIQYTEYSYVVRPVVYLNYDIKLSGSGTKESPYVIIE